MSNRAFRVALIVGTLSQGGAEKQCLFLVRALDRLGVTLRVFTLTSGEHYESALREAGHEPVYLGAASNPLARLVGLTRALREFRPHLVQATHFFTGAYAASAAPLVGAISVGAVRNDVHRELRDHGVWGPLLLRAPSATIANSYAARENAARRGFDPRSIFVLPNAIDLDEFDGAARRPSDVELPAGLLALVVANPRPSKRIDRFVDALGAARRIEPRLVGAVLGEGPDRSALKEHARSVGLDHDALRFLGRTDSVPALMKRAAMLVVTSDNEGFPNVLLEAMAAELPVVSTPAGDARRIVTGAGGTIVDFDDRDALVAAMIGLAREPERRRELGRRGRESVRERYGIRHLPHRLARVYHEIAAFTGAAIPGEIGA